MCDSDSVLAHQLKEECRLAQRFGCWVREVSDRAALPLLWCGNTAGEKTLFILAARCGQTPCSLSNTWWTVKHEDIVYIHKMPVHYVFMPPFNQIKICIFHVQHTLRAVLCRLCIVSLRWRNRKGQELIRYILSIATRTILYQRWKPLARLSLMKKVCENTKPCCSSPKKIGPSRPGHTWSYRTRAKQWLWRNDKSGIFLVFFFGDTHTHTRMSLFTSQLRLRTQAWRTTLNSCGCLGCWWLRKRMPVSSSMLTKPGWDVGRERHPFTAGRGGK